MLNSFGNCVDVAAVPVLLAAALAPAVPMRAIDLPIIRCFRQIGRTNLIP